MYQRKHIYKSSRWKHRLYAVCLSGMMCVVLLCMHVIAYGGPAVYADGVPGGNVTDPAVRAVDIAKPAVVRILTEVIGKLTVTFSNGQVVTFPQTPQNGIDGYPLLLSGTGTFISAHGDILTADHVVHPVQDDKAALDQFLQQTAAPDVASYLNQHSKQQVTADQVAQELADGQLASTSQYPQMLSRVYLSTDFSGPLTASNFQNIPPSQYADVDQIKQYSLFSAQDTAIIHVSGMDNMPMVQLGDSTAVQEQDQLTIIGFPGNGDVSTAPTDFLHSSINQVFVSSIKANGGSPVIQVGGNVEQGDSGGPALDSHGNVVGIVSFGAAPQNGGSTSFLRPSQSAQQLIQAAGINTTPSPLQKAWLQAFSDYASQASGHWHQSTQEFQRITTQYPQFKAVNPFLQYASQQAKTETATQGSQSNNPGGSSGSGNTTLVYLIGGGAALLLIVLVVVGLTASRRRQPAPANQVAGYNAFPGSGSGFPDPYGAVPLNDAQGFMQQSGQGVPLTPTPPPTYPSYLQQSAYRSPGQVPPSAISAQPSYPPSNPQGMYQSQQSQPASPIAADVSAFGAPLPTTPGLDSTVSSKPRTPVSQWRTWPCGHTNRDDARFCGICGESAQPVARRVEQ